MKRVVKVVCIAIVAALIMGAVFVGCEGNAGDKKTLQFKEDMPEELDFNVAFDVEKYVEYEEGESLTLEAKYSENGTEKTYLVAGLLFTPTTLNDVTITVSYKTDADTKISKTLKIKVPVPSMASVPQLEVGEGEKLVFADLLDKEKYPNFNYTSLVPVTIKATKMILPDATEEVMEGKTEYTFDEGGQYTLCFELSNAGGVYNGTANIKVSLILTDNEKDDLTNNNIREGSGITFKKVNEARPEANSDWHYEVDADPNTNYAVNYWANYCEIWLPEPINMQDRLIQFDLFMGEDTFTDYQIMLIDTSIVAEKTLRVDTAGEWHTVTVSNEDLLIHSSLESIQRIRIIFGAGNTVKVDGVFPEKVDARIYIALDNLKIV